MIVKKAGLLGLAAVVGALGIAAPGLAGGNKYDPTTAGLQLRAERSGEGDGRTYTVAWKAVFDDKTCESSAAADSDPENDPFVITVPHDMRGGADWK